MGKQIFLVIEDGTGYIHKAFNLFDAAEKYAEQMSKETGYDNFEVIAVDIE